MKRDMDLIREILLRLEDLPLPAGVSTEVNGWRPEMEIVGYEPEAVTYHIRMLREAGLIECPGSQPADGGVIFRELSWEGRDFLDTVRDPEVWKRTKEGASKMGGWTFGLLKDLGTAYLKHVAKERLGLDL